MRSAKRVLMRFSQLIMALGFLLLVAGIVVFLSGPSGPIGTIVINSRTISIFDFSRTYRGLQVAALGLLMVLATVGLGNPLVLDYAKLIRKIGTVVPGRERAESEELSDFESRTSARIFVAFLGVLMAMWFLALFVLLSGLGSVPYVIQPLVYDLALRFMFFVLYLLFSAALVYFLFAEVLGSVLSGIVAVVSSRVRTAQTDQLDIVQTQYLFAELRSSQSLLLYGTIIIMAYLAFTHLVSIQPPLLLAAVSIWAFAFGKSMILSFQKACHQLHVKPERMFRLKRFRSSLQISFWIWKGILFLVFWRALLVWTLPSVAAYIGQSADMSAMGQTSFADFIQTFTVQTIGFFSKVVGEYTIYVITLLGILGALYLYILPPYFLRRSKRKFFHKVVLAIVVFAFSLVSQLIISYFIPSTTSIIYSALIFLALVAIVEFIQKTYEDALDALSA